MNIAKHMEAVFVAALAFASTASVAVESLPQAQAHVAPPLASSIATTGKMAVVIVSAKHMSDAGKHAAR